MPAHLASYRQGVVCCVCHAPSMIDIAKLCWSNGMYETREALPFIVYIKLFGIQVSLRGTL